jgi:hypothetical protein
MLYKVILTTIKMPPNVFNKKPASQTTNNTPLLEEILCQPTKTSKMPNASHVHTAQVTTGHKHPKHQPKDNLVMERRGLGIEEGIRRT